MGKEAVRSTETTRPLKASEEPEDVKYGQSLKPECATQAKEICKKHEKILTDLPLYINCGKWKQVVQDMQNGETQGYEPSL